MPDTQGTQTRTESITTRGNTDYDANWITPLITAELELTGLNRTDLEKCRILPVSQPQPNSESQLQPLHRILRGTGESGYVYVIPLATGGNHFSLVVIDRTKEPGAPSRIIYQNSIQSTDNPEKSNGIEKQVRGVLKDRWLFHNGGFVDDDKKMPRKLKLPGREKKRAEWLNQYRQQATETAFNKSFSDLQHPQQTNGQHDCGPLVCHNAGVLVRAIFSEEPERETLERRNTRYKELLLPQAEARTELRERHQQVLSAMRRAKNIYYLVDSAGGEHNDYNKQFVKQWEQTQNQYRDEDEAIERAVWNVVSEKFRDNLPANFERSFDEPPETQKGLLRIGYVLAPKYLKEEHQDRDGEAMRLRFATRFAKAVADKGVLEDVINDVASKGTLGTIASHITEKLPPEPLKKADFEEVFIDTKYGDEETATIAHRELEQATTMVHRDDKKKDITVTNTIQDDGKTVRTTIKGAKSEAPENLFEKAAAIYAAVYLKKAWEPSVVLDNITLSGANTDEQKAAAEAQCIAAFRKFGFVVEGVESTPTEEQEEIEGELGVRRSGDDALRSTPKSDPGVAGGEDAEVEPIIPQALYELQTALELDTTNLNAHERELQRHLTRLTSHGTFDDSLPARLETLHKTAVQKSVEAGRAVDKGKDLIRDANSGDQSQPPSPTVARQKAEDELDQQVDAVKAAASEVLGLIGSVRAQVATQLDSIAKEIMAMAELSKTAKTANGWEKYRRQATATQLAAQGNQLLELVEEGADARRLFAQAQNNLIEQEKALFAELDSITHGLEAIAAAEEIEKEGEVVKELGAQGNEKLDALTWLVGNTTEVRAKAFALNAALTDARAAVVAATTAADERDDTQTLTFDGRRGVNGLGIEEEQQSDDGEEDAAAAASGGGTGGDGKGEAEAVEIGKGKAAVEERDAREKKELQQTFDFLGISKEPASQTGSTATPPQTGAAASGMDDVDELLRGEGLADLLDEIRGGTPNDVDAKVSEGATLLHQLDISPLERQKQTRNLKEAASAARGKDKKDEHEVGAGAETKQPQSPVERETQQAQLDRWLEDLDKRTASVNQVVASLKAQLAIVADTGVLTREQTIQEIFREGELRKSYGQWGEDTIVEAQNAPEMGKLMLGDISEKEQPEGIQARIGTASQELERAGERLCQAVDACDQMAASFLAEAQATFGAFVASLITYAGEEAAGQSPQERWNEVAEARICGQRLLYNLQRTGLSEKDLEDNVQQLESALSAMMEAVGVDEQSVSEEEAAGSPDGHGGALPPGEEAELGTVMQQGGTVGSGGGKRPRTTQHVGEKSQSPGARSQASTGSGNDSDPEAGGASVPVKKDNLVQQQILAQEAVALAAQLRPAVGGGEQAGGDGAGGGSGSSDGDGATSSGGSSDVISNASLTSGSTNIGGTAQDGAAAGGNERPTRPASTGPELPSTENTVGRQRSSSVGGEFPQGAGGANLSSSSASMFGGNVAGNEHVVPGGRPEFSSDDEEAEADGSNEKGGEEAVAVSRRRPRSGGGKPPPVEQPQNGVVGETGAAADLPAEAKAKADEEEGREERDTLVL